MSKYDVDKCVDMSIVRENVLLEANFSEIF
jgi:hypothetical protein